MARVNPLFRSPLYAHTISNGGYFPQECPKPAPSKSKVVSIPVHFVNSDEVIKKKTADPLPADRSAAAVKIQKAFRGFTVRKNIKIVRKIDAEVGEIERKMKTKEEMDLIARDSKERLKVNEMLMSLLLRLDSVRGVRDYRKKVIRRVISLQEALDSVSADQSAAASMEAAPDSETLDADAADTAQDEEADTLEIGDQSPILDSMDILQDEKFDALVEEARSEDTKRDQTEAPADQDQNSNLADSMEVPEDEKPDALETESWELVQAEEPNNAAEDEESPMVEQSLEVRESAVDSEPKETKDLEMKDVMERMVAENEKLKGLVVELCKRNAEQCKLMGGLAERVDHLEKAVKKMEKKKKRKDNSSLVSAFDKKCGRDSSTFL